MKKFGVYEHPTLGLKAVKERFSWPALFLGPLWMIFRGLWAWVGFWIALQFGLVMIIGLLMEVGAPGSEDFWGSILLLCTGVLWLIPACRGNAWCAKRLIARGYEKLLTVQAGTRDAAVAQVARSKQRLDRDSAHDRTVARQAEVLSLEVRSSSSSVGDLNRDGWIYYKHSGRFTSGAVALSLFIGALLAICLAFVYAYAILHIPFVELNFILTCLYGALSGIIAGVVLKVRHVRNTTVAAMVGSIIGLVAVYASWVVWILGFRARVGNEWGLVDAAALSIFPSILWTLILKVNEVGSWIIGGYRPTGIALWIIWSVEATLIVGAAAISASFAMLEEPYCEACGTWCTSKPRVAEFQPCETDELRRRLEAKDLAFLETLGAPVDGANSWLQINLHQCEKCGLTNTLTVEAFTVTVDEKNKRTKKTRTILEKLLVTRAECIAIQQIDQRVKGLAVAAAPEGGLGLGQEQSPGQDTQAGA